MLLIPQETSPDLYPRVMASDEQLPNDLQARFLSEEEGWSPVPRRTLEDITRLIDTGDRSWVALTSVFGGCHVLIQTDALGTPLMEQHARDLMQWAYTALSSICADEPPALRSVRLSPYQRDAAEVGLTLS